MFGKKKPVATPTDRIVTRSLAQQRENAIKDQSDRTFDQSIINQNIIYNTSTIDQTLLDDPFDTTVLSCVNSTVNSVGDPPIVENTLTNTIVTSSDKSANSTHDQARGEISNEGALGFELPNTERPVNNNINQNSIDNNSRLENRTQRINMAAPGSTVALKDAIGVVPEFDGTNIPVSEFLEGCDEARAMIENDAEKALTRLIRSKIRGEAKGALLGHTFDSINDLKQFIKSIFVPAKSVNQLLGELGYEYQRDREGVITFANRIKELGTRIVEAEVVNNGRITEAFKTSLQDNQLECFKRGLKMEISHRLPPGITAQNMVTEAIKVEREVEAQKALRRLDMFQGHGPNNASNRRRLLTCQLCRKEGHEADKCLQTMTQVPCKTCGRTNHATERCRFDPNNRGQGYTSCQLCNRLGHSAAQCHTIIRCQTCDKIGHTAKDCERTEQNRIVCQICNKTGHVAKDCFQLKRQETRNQEYNRPKLSCQLCGKIGHTASECRARNPTAVQVDSVPAEVTCNYCKKPGHFIRECKLRMENNARVAGNGQGAPMRSASSEPPRPQERSTNVIIANEQTYELF